MWWGDGGVWCGDGGVWCGDGGVWCGAVVMGVCGVVLASSSL